MPAEQTLPTHRATYDPARTRVLWVTVACFAALIVGLWGWAIARQVKFFPWSKAPEVRVITDAQVYWNHIFAEQQAQDDAYVETKDNLQRVIEQFTASSSAVAATSTFSTHTLNTKPQTNTKQ